VHFMHGEVPVRLFFCFVVLMLLVLYVTDINTIPCRLSFNYRFCTECGGGKLKTPHTYTDTYIHTCTRSFSILVSFQSLFPFETFCFLLHLALSLSLSMGVCVAFWSCTL
jgi:hypothetical protein